MENRLEIRKGNQPSNGKGRSSSRTHIFPHRSVRFSDIATGRIVLALMLAATISFLMFHFAVPIMKIHTNLAIGLAQKLDLPIVGSKSVDVFNGLEPAQAPLTSVPRFEQVGNAARAAWIAAVVLLTILALRFQLIRSVLVLLILLLLVSAVVNSIFERYEFDAGVFGQIWYRQAMLVWILLPWFTSFLFLIFQPRMLEGVGWIVLSQLYSFAFSVVRMVFAMGILHYSGLLFFPTVWFLVGTLAELIFLLQFYSISIYRATGKQYQARSSWASLF